MNHRIENLRDLPKSRAIFLDVSVWEFLRIAGQEMPLGYRRRLESFQHGPGIFKIDYALSEAVPWKSEACRRAGTIHLGGGIDEIAAAERDVSEGKVPERPFVLVAQQSLFDETRAPHGQHTLWVYCHVPFDCKLDVSDQIESQIERFAPGFRDCILACHKMGPADLERSNPNLIGGDINGGAANLTQLIARPSLALRLTARRCRAFICAPHQPHPEAEFAACAAITQRARPCVIISGNTRSHRANVVAASLCRGALEVLLRQHGDTAPWLHRHLYEQFARQIRPANL